MGITSYTQKLETNFLNQLDPKDVPKHLDPKDQSAVHDWFKEAFAYWFLQHRDELLGREWLRRGWAEAVLTAAESGELEERFRVKPECVEKIDAWMEDRID